MSHHSETSAGTIEGLYLPHLAWEMLHRESIGSLSQLRAVAGRLEQFAGIRTQTAQAIRRELDRVAAPGEHIFGQEQLSPWGA
jgi:hypothetical protein